MITVHRPGKHYFIYQGEQYGPYATEVEVACLIKTFGIDLKKKVFRSIGLSNFRVVTFWR